MLNRPNTTYLLTRDLTFPLGGLLIKAEGITLDMDGHRLVYNNEKPIALPNGINGPTKDTISASRSKGGCT